MFSGQVAFKNNFDISREEKDVFENALIYQNPPYKLGLKMAKEKIATSCTDISDGLSSSIYDLCNASDLGVIIDESKIPIDSPSLKIAKLLNIRAMQLTFAGGEIAKEPHPFFSLPSLLRLRKNIIKLNLKR